MWLRSTPFYHSILGWWWQDWSSISYLWINFFPSLRWNWIFFFDIIPCFSNKCSKYPCLRLKAGGLNFYVFSYWGLLKSFLSYGFSVVSSINYCPSILLYSWWKSVACVGEVSWVKLICDFVLRSLGNILSALTIFSLTYLSANATSLENGTAEGLVRIVFQSGEIDYLFLIDPFPFTPSI